MFQTKAKIIFNKKLAESHFLMRIASKGIAKSALPGQFVNIRVSDKTNPLLRRPFSFHHINKDSFDILYKLIGKGTQILSEKKQGEELDVLGPLGNGFNYELLVTSYSLLILIAGGIGVAPLVALAEELTKRITHNAQRLPAGQAGTTLVIIGAKTENEILCEKDFKKLGFDVRIATEDGSAGKKALATELLSNHFYTPGVSKGKTRIFGCGPNAMLKEVARIAEKNKIEAQVLLEEHMACGIGACLGCAIKIKDQRSLPRRQAGKIKNNFEYKLVCKNGPVFNADEIIW